MSLSGHSHFRKYARGVIGALVVVGLSSIFTLEIWRQAWLVPIEYLIAYSTIGLASVAFITNEIGFLKKKQEENLSTREQLIELALLFLESFTAVYIAVSMFGIVGIDDPIHKWLRVGLTLVVPLSFGASLANELLPKEINRKEKSLYQNMGVYLLGSFFIIFPLAPTRELQLISAYTSWSHVGLILATSLGMIYVILYELEFKERKVSPTYMSRFLLGKTLVVYLVAFIASFTLLLTLGELIGTPWSFIIRQTIILAFPATAGASAGMVAQ